MPLTELNTALASGAEQVGKVLAGLDAAGERMRTGIGGTLESAIASAAAAACALRIEAALAISPRMPYATVQSVCADVEHAAEEALSVLPYVITGMVFGGDLRAAPLLVAVLADRPDAGDIFAGVDSALTALRSGLQTQLDPNAPDTARAARSKEAIDTVLSGTLGAVQGAGQIVPNALMQTVSRVHDAAKAGAASVRSKALELTERLRLGSPARTLPGRAVNSVSLERVYSQVVAQSYAVLAKPGYRELYRVIAVGEGSRAEFAVSGKSTYLTLSGENFDLYEEAVRETTVFAQSEELARAEAPLTTAVSGDTIVVDGDASTLPAGRALLVRGVSVDGGETLAHAATLVSAELLGADTRLTISPQLPHALQRDTVVVYGNVALATHGETAAQILGSGDASASFQRFELKRTPLTWRSAANETGADSELTVRIGDVAWTEVSTLYAAASDDRAYTLSTDEQGKTWVVFGDGVRGARLPSGSNNVRASYRQGLGAEGNVGADKLTQLMTRPLGLKGVANPAAAEGGTDPEAVDEARRSMPLGTRTLGRAVSLLDYEDFALAYTGVGKAQARVLELAAGQTIAITVAGSDGTELSGSNPVRANLLLALKGGGDPHVAVELLSYRASTFRVGLKVRRDPAYALGTVLAAVEASLREHFSFSARSLGQPVLQSEVIAAAHAVPGVVAIDLDYLYGGTSPAAQTVVSHQTRLLAARMHVSGGAAVPAELLTLDPAPFDVLEEMA